VCNSVLANLRIVVSSQWGLDINMSRTSTNKRNQQRQHVDLVLR